MHYGLNPQATNQGAHIDLELNQMNVNTTFLDGVLNEEMYKEQLVDFIIHAQALGVQVKPFEFMALSNHRT